MAFSQRINKMVKIFTNKTVDFATLFMYNCKCAIYKW